MHSRVAGSVARLALVPGILFFAPAVAIANEDTVSAQIEALRQIVERQQAQLDIQQSQLEAQRAELDALKVGATGSTPAADTDHKRLEEPERSAPTAKLAAQEAPTVRMVGNRPTIASADGRSTLSLRSNVQLDFGHYDQIRAGPLATDFRRGSVGTTRENDAARDLSDGAYFRRARFGVEGIFAAGLLVSTPVRVWRFRHRRIGAYQRRLHRLHRVRTIHVSTRRVFAARQSRRWDAAGRPAVHRTRDSAELSRALGAADGRLGVGLRAGGSRWLGALTLTGSHRQ